jgi:hypothetical protein
MDWSIPEDVTTFVRKLDDFIEREIKPLQDEHPQYFDHRPLFSLAIHPAVEHREIAWRTACSEWLSVPITSRNAEVGTDMLDG